MDASSISSTSRRRFGHFLKRWLYLVHRWLGIASCVLFAMWFVSGLVMVYVPYPSLGKSEWLDGAEPIAWSRVRIGAADAMRIAHADPASVQLSLEMRDGAPAWRITSADGNRSAVSAVDGVPLGSIGIEAAGRIAARFAGISAIPHVARLERDQWTVAGGYDRDRPLYRADLGDAAGRSLYISSRSGAVVLDTSRRERLWNWLGSVPHWLYPTVLRQDQPAWRQVVLWTSGPCIIVAASGIWIGILRLRVRRRYRHDRITPYRGWFEWHHLFGLAGSLSLLAWIVSGWLSVDPGRWFKSAGLGDAAIARYEQRGSLPPIDVSRLATSPRFADTRRLRLVQVDGAAFLALDAPAATSVLDMASLQETRPSPVRLVEAAARMLPARPVSIERLDREDDYYYSQDSSRSLPVLRLKFHDPARTWVYIDLASGEIAANLDSTRRAYRWWFDAAHKLDFRGLYQSRPVWDVIVWLLSSFGIVISVSGIVIGWRRLRRRRRSAPPGR